MERSPVPIDAARRRRVCLRELLDERTDRETFAYGNSASDLPHMRLVRHGQLVNGSLAARRDAAAKCGIACVEWS